MTCWLGNPELSPPSPLLMALICSELELLMTTSQTLLLLQLILSNKSFLYLKVESGGLLCRAFERNRESSCSSDDSKSSECEYDRGEILIKHAPCVHLICVLSLVCGVSICVVLSDPDPSCVSPVSAVTSAQTPVPCPGRALLTEPVKPRAPGYLL